MKSNKSTPILLIAILSASLSIQTVYASSYAGYVEKLVVGRDGHQVFIHMKDAPTTCNLEHPLGFNYAFSLRDHEAGREMLSALLAANMAGTRVVVQGTDVCTISSDMENVAYIYVL